MSAQGRDEQADGASPLRVALPRFSDYLVYVDESGDHAMASIDPAYPVFVLALCVLHKRHYWEAVAPKITQFKLLHFGHDNIVLHENEIRKQKGAFSFLSHLPTRHAFMSDLSGLMAALEFRIIACVIDKRRLPKGEATGSNPYHLALDACLESLHEFLAERNQHDLQTHIVFECRGRREDADLELEFRRICNAASAGRHGHAFQIVFADKRNNLPGLQLADLVARPIGLNDIRPYQPNQAFELIRPKLQMTRHRLMGAGEATPAGPHEWAPKSERPR